MLFGIFRCKEGNYIARIQVSNDIDQYLNFSESVSLK